MEDLLEERNKFPKTNLQDHFDFISRAEEILHPNHYVIILSKRWLAPLICQPPTDPKFQRSEWEQKEIFIQQILAILENLNFGLCKDKGRLLFEICNIKLALARKLQDEGKIDVISNHGVEKSMKYEKNAWVWDPYFIFM